MNDREINAGLVAPGEYAPAGEAQGETARFSAEQVAQGFEVEIDRVHRAMAGEFGLGEAGREAALMRLGAFTPRPDHGWGIGEAAPGEESDKVIPPECQTIVNRWA